MNRSLKKAVVLMMFAALSVVSFGCAKEGAPLQPSEMMEAQAMGIVAGITSTDELAEAEFLQMEEDDIKTFFEEYGYSIDGKTFINALEGWMGQREDIGEILDISEPVISSTDKELTATINLKGSVRDAKCVVIFDERGKITSITTSGIYTFGENMEKAGLNTLLGMGTTFVILIFLSLVISLFRFIPDPEKIAKKKTEGVDNAVSQIAEREELTNDDELVAVISAAIAAYEGSVTGTAPSTDGFVVRSIRRHY